MNNALNKLASFMVLRESVHWRWSYGHLYNEMQGEACRLMDELVSPVKITMLSEMHQEASSGRMLKN